MPPKTRKQRTNIVVKVPPPSKAAPSTNAPPPPCPSTRRDNLPRQPSAAQPASPSPRRKPAPAATATATEPDDADTDSSSDAHVHNRLVVTTSPARRRTQRAETEVVPETDHEGTAPASSLGEFGLPRSGRPGRGYAPTSRGARRKGAAVTGEKADATQQEQAVSSGHEEKQDVSEDEDEDPPLPTRIPAAAKRAAAAAAAASTQKRTSRETRSAAASSEEKAAMQGDEGEGQSPGEQHDGEDEVDQLADTDSSDTDSSPRTTTKRKDKGKGKAPAPGPASSFSTKRKAPSQRSGRAAPSKKKKRVAPPARDSGSEEDVPGGEGEGEISPDELSDEDDERPPEGVFSHRDGGGSRVPDRIWLHREWHREGKRDKVARWIKEHGGKIMKRMEDAHYAILPDWTSDNYAKLYAEAFNCGALPTLYAWLLAARDDTAQHGVPCRPNPLQFASPRPLPRRADDRRSERYLRLSDAELDELARLYILCDEGDMSRGEMFSRMQREFYSELESRSTTISAYRDKFDLHKRTIKQRARHLREDALRAQAPNGRPPSAFRSPSPPPLRSPSRTRTRTHSPAPPRPAQRPRRRSMPHSPAPDPLAALAQRYRRSPASVDALLRACTLDAEAAGRALRRLERWERAVGVAAEEEGEEGQEGEAVERAWDEVLRGVWRAEDDEALREEEGASDAELSRRSGGRWTASEVAERRELLRARPDERWGWEVTREELRRAREAGSRGGADDDEDDDE
ncbi:hypothetical protein JCM9279_006096 [Rhodotorula babjevae]